KRSSTAAFSPSSESSESTASSLSSSGSPLAGSRLGYMPNCLGSLDPVGPGLSSESAVLSAACPLRLRTIGVDHRRFHVLAPLQLLDRADIVPLALSIREVLAGNDPAAGRFPSLETMTALAGLNRSGPHGTRHVHTE